MNDVDKHIEQYLKGALSPDESEAFEKKMAEDPALEKAVKSQKIFNSAIDLLADEDIKKTFLKKRLARKVIYLRLSMAAGFLLLLTAASWWWAKDQFSKERMLADFSIEAIAQDDRAETDSIRTADSIYTEASGAFVNKNNSVAILLFSQLRTDSIYSTSANYHLGHLYFRLGEYQKASEAFKASLSNPGFWGANTLDEIRVNLLLSRYGAGLIPQDSLIHLKRVLENIDPDRAQTLGRRLRHPLRKIWN